MGTRRPPSATGSRDAEAAAAARVMGAPRDPEELDAAGAPVHAALPTGTRMGPVHLKVADLARSLDYYGAAIGLEVLARWDGGASLGAAGVELLVLAEEPGARPAAGHTGLYHFALLVPERAGLAAWLAHAARDRVPLTGVADHFVSEALYLSDPDGHGIEIDWDRPRERWEGQVAARMTTLSLDVDDLMHELDDPAGEPFDRLPDGTVMGHVHLKVADVPAAVVCYRDALGFGLMAQLGGQAAFMAAGGYHHHSTAVPNTNASTTATPTGPARQPERGAGGHTEDLADRAVGWAVQRGRHGDVGKRSP